MFNFLHNIGIGIVSAFVAFVGVFQQQPIAEIPVTVQASSTIEIISVSSSTIPIKAETSIVTQKEKAVNKTSIVKTPSLTPVETRSTPTPVVSPAPVVKQLSDEEIRRNAQIQLGVENDKRQALFEAQVQADKELAAKQAAEQAIQDKQDKLDAINLKIANLNAKYAKDSAAVNSSPMSTSQRDAQMRVITDQYNIDYNSLQAEFQLVKYSK